jgi:hypothetical protein
MVVGGFYEGGARNENNAKPNNPDSAWAPQSLAVIFVHGSFEALREKRRSGFLETPTYFVPQSDSNG